MQTQSVVLNIGADVGKDEIAVACAEESFSSRMIANRRSELKAWLKGLPTGSRIGMESTSSYHELLAELAHQLGFVVYVLNPKDTRHYAKAMGLRGKTDRVDAKLIARLIARVCDSSGSIPPCRLPRKRPLSAPYLLRSEAARAI